MKNFPEILEQINTYITFKEKEYLFTIGKPYLNLEEFVTRMDKKDSKNIHSKNHKILHLDLPIFVNIEIYLRASDNTPCVWFNSIANTNSSYHGELVAIDYELNSTHKHDFFELTYIYSGQCAVNIQNEKHIFGEKELYILDRNCEHEDLRNESSGIFVYIGIQPKIFNDFFLESMAKNNLYTLLVGDLSKKLQTSYISVKLTSQTADQVENYLALIYNEMSIGQKGYVQMMQIYLLRLIEAISIDNVGQLCNFDEHSRNYLLFHKITTYIDKHLDHISLELLTDEFHYQKDYYNRIIKNYTGMTFSEYMKKLRLEKAKHLLCNTQLSIKEISEILGYSDESYLFRIFNHELGITPNEFRSGNKSILSK